MDSGPRAGMAKEKVQYGSTKNRRGRGELWEWGELRGNEKKASAGAVYALADALCPGRLMSRRGGVPLTGAEEFEFYEESGSGEGADESQGTCGGLYGHVFEAVRPDGVYAFTILRGVRVHGNRRFDADDVVYGPALGFEHSDQGVEDGLGLCYGVAGMSDVSVAVSVDLAGQDEELAEAGDLEAPVKNVAAVWGI